MAVYFISDLHLSDTTPALSELFLNFLAGDAKKADALYILGDLFEFWLGDDDPNPHNQAIIKALKAFAHAGTPVYYMHGNRDFLIGEQFVIESGCQFLADPTVIELYGSRVLLMHGDLLCTLDLAYQRFRKCIQHPFVKKLARLLPLGWRYKIAHFLRKKPLNTKPSPLNKWDVELKTVYKMLRKHNTTTLIHGHTHKQGIHRFRLDQKDAKRIVLGDWHTTNGSVLIYSPTDTVLQTIT